MYRYRALGYPKWVLAAKEKNNVLTEVVLLLLGKKGKFLFGRKHRHNSKIESWWCFDGWESSHM